MPKNSKKQIELDETKVINELQKNSKESIDAIAKKCGFSRQKVWRIIKKLEKDKTIWGYSCVIDDESMNLNRYVILIRRSSTAVGSNIKNMIEKTLFGKKDDLNTHILCSYYVHGDFDWMFCFTARDIRHAKRFVEYLSSSHPDIIKEIKLMELIFPLQKCGIYNPHADKLKDFFLP